MPDPFDTPPETVGAGLVSEAKASAALDGETQTWSAAAVKFAETLEQLGPDAVKSFIALVEDGKPEMSITFTLQDGTEEILTSADIRQGIELLAMKNDAKSQIWKDG